MTVSQRFTSFLSNIAITDLQFTDGTNAHKGVRSCLNAHYYNSSSQTLNSLLMGSWAKDTQVRPPRDVDVLFVLPQSVYDRYHAKSGNKQSQLLQEVKNVIKAKYSNTEIRGDGPAVIVGFSGYAVDLVPAFAYGTQYRICNTKDGGSYVTTDPKADIKNMCDSNQGNNGNSRDLIRMCKKWQSYCAVPLKSFVLELLAINFLSSYEHRGKSVVYYDYMTRDFFKYLKDRSSLSYVTVPGTYNTIWLGSVFQSRAETAYNRAEKACRFEADPTLGSAGDEWQKIFGIDIPKA